MAAPTNWDLSGLDVALLLRGSQLTGHTARQTDGWKDKKTGKKKKERKREGREKKELNLIVELT